MARRRTETGALRALVWVACAAALVQCGRSSESYYPPASRTFSTAGSVCGVAAIKGEQLDRIRGAISGCGIDRPVSVSSVSGVQLSPAAVVDCDAAKALNRWVSRAAEPVFRDAGGGLEELRVASGYACRTRNNQPGAKLSEHAKGKAIDISAFSLRDGRTVSVESGWGSGADGRRLKRVHAKACDTFGTVLGPNSDRFHRDHFHLDTERHYNGSYCR